MPDILQKLVFRRTRSKKGGLALQALPFGKDERGRSAPSGLSTDRYQGSVSAVMVEPYQGCGLLIVPALP